MAEMNDMDLVRDYAQRNSEAAFAELVRRHINLVYSVAMRYVGNSQDAQDVTQAVFIILAKKASGLRDKTIVAGWLYETTRFTAANLLRSRIRRESREQEAYMHSTLNDSETESAWQQVAPLLENAMGRLSEKERTLLALHFFENKSGAETAAALGIEEWAARKRVNRAVEKLRKFFMHRGVGISAGVLMGAMTASSIQAAPAALASSITAAAMAKGALATGSTLTLVKGALKLMAWTKVKTAIVVGVGVLLATGATTAIIQTINAPADSKSLTLKINPEVFIRNVMAHADGTMNTPSNHYADILLDVLRTENFRLGKNPIELNTQTGEITTQNTPENLEIFRQIVADLNREDGVRTYPPMDASAPKRQVVLVTAHFYKMTSGDFEKLGLGKPTSPGRKGDARFGTSGESPFWMLSPESLQKSKDALKAAGFKSFSSPRIQTAFGATAGLFFGETVDHLTLKCLPLASIDERTIELKVQASTTGKFNRNAAGDWPTFANRTNCAVFARATAESGGGLVFRAQNRDGLPANNLLVLIEMKNVP